MGSNEHLSRKATGMTCALLTTCGVESVSLRHELLNLCRLSRVAYLWSVDSNAKHLLRVILPPTRHNPDLNTLLFPSRPRHTCISRPMLVVSQEP